MTFEREKALAPRERENFLTKPRFPNTWLSTDKRKTSLPRTQSFYEVPKLPELAFASHENSLRRRTCFQKLRTLHESLKL